MQKSESCKGGVNMNINCERCKAPCRIAGSGNPEAKMLRLSKSKGLCINCAVHDYLRNTYPINMHFAKFGPKGLLFPQIQKIFARIMRTAPADAQPDEINWEAIIENWDLPFPHKIKRSATNPISQQELDNIARGA